MFPQVGGYGQYGSNLTSKKAEVELTALARQLNQEWLVAGWINFFLGCLCDGLVWFCALDWCLIGFVMVCLIGVVFDGCCV